jgi:hypothetical protein
MQPTFLPWLGYFAMIDMVDEFIFLDSVQFSKRSWQQRNRIKTQNGSQWVSVSVSTKGCKNQLIKDVRLDNTSKQLDKIRKSIEHAYRKAAYFNEYFPIINEILVEKDNLSIADLNIDLAIALSDALGINCPHFLRSSSLDASGTKAALLANICLERNARYYLSAPGSREYIEQSTAFEDANIAVEYLLYEHPIYEQRHGEFESHMSVIDLLFNCGPNSMDVIRTGVRRL